MSPRPARALVIGASGFLGSRLLAQAPKDIDLVGTGFSRPVPPGPWRAVELDVSLASRIEALVAKERPSAVVYASYVTNNHTVTTDGAAAAARAAGRAGARFLFTSTDLVFDGAAGNYDESALARPAMLYGQHKLEAEGHVWIEHEDAVILRPALMAGEGWRFQRPAFECGLLAAGQPCPLFSDEWRSPLHVDDVARAIWDLVSLDVRGVFHLGGPERMTRVELGRRVCEMYGFDPALIRETKRTPDRPKDVSLNSARLTGLLGWQPRRLEAGSSKLEADTLASSFQLPASSY